MVCYMNFAIKLYDSIMTPLTPIGPWPVIFVRSPDMLKAEHPSLCMVGFIGKFFIASKMNANHRGGTTAPPGQFVNGGHN